MVAQSDLLFYKLASRTGPASGNALSRRPRDRTTLLRPCSTFGPFMHQASWFPVIWVPVDTVVKMMNIFSL